MEETGVPGENTDMPQVTDKLYHIMLHQVHPAWAGFEYTTLVVIGTGCIGSYKSNYHMITTTTVLEWELVSVAYRPMSNSSAIYHGPEWELVIVVYRPMSNSSAIYYGGNKLHFDEMMTANTL